MAAVAGSQDGVTRPSRRLDPRVRLLWWTVGGGWTSAATVASVFWTVALDLPGLFPFAVAAGGCLLAGLVPLIRYRRWRYEIRRRDVFLSRGALFHVMTLIPFDRIQFVETRQGPLDRLFRLTQVVIYTAAGRAGQIPGLDRPEAESIREELSLVAGAATV
jgi:uncharacterized protein